MAVLCLIRHGQSEWNATAKWTGLIDIPLSKEGIKQSEKAGMLLHDYRFDAAFTSILSRAIETLEIIKHTINAPMLPTIKDQALNERDYGEFTGKNKWDLEKKFGKDIFHQIRRGWDHPIPNGETLKDVYNRVIPFYINEIKPLIDQGKNVLIVAHGNSLRALIKYLEHIKDEDIDKLDLETGQVTVYNINKSGKIISKKIEK